MPARCARFGSRLQVKPASVVCQRLRSHGWEVFAVSPRADKVEGDRCYRELGSIPGGVEAVVIGTSPAYACETAAADGSLVIVDAGHNRIRRAGADGTIATLAGNGAFTPRSAGDEGRPATGVPVPHRRASRSCRMATSSSPGPAGSTA